MAYYKTGPVPVLVLSMVNKYNYSLDNSEKEIACLIINE